jgi:hypothetical protein
VLGGKVFRVAADEIDVWTFFEDETRGVDGIAQPLDAGDATGTHDPGHAAIHEQCVELDFAIAGEERASACVERLVVLEDGDGGFYRVNSGGPTLEQGVAGEERTANTEGVGIDVAVGDSPRAAMNEKYGLIRHTNSSSYMGISIVCRRKARI